MVQFDTFKPVQKIEYGTSYNGCGLNCAHQLRASVNMIHEMSAIKKVQEIEIKTMKSKQKRKLQRKWVPRSVFDIQELFNIDSILSEVQCAKSIMPRWKKRQRRIPNNHDSHDLSKGAINKSSYATLNPSVVREATRVI